MISFIPALYGVDMEDTVCTEMASGTSYEITEPANFFRILEALHNVTLYVLYLIICDDIWHVHLF